MPVLFWFRYDNVLFPSDLPPGSAVVLSETDCIVPAIDLYHDLRDERPDDILTTMLPKMDHGAFLMDGIAQDRIACMVHGATAVLPDDRR